MNSSLLPYSAEQCSLRFRAAVVGRCLHCVFDAYFEQLEGSGQRVGGILQDHGRNLGIGGDSVVW